MKAKLQESAPDRVDPFMANAPAEVKKILGNIKNYQVGHSNGWNGHFSIFVYAQKFGIGKIKFVKSLQSKTQ